MFTPRPSSPTLLSSFRTSMISIEDDFDERQGRQSNPQLEPFDTFLDFEYENDDTLPNEINEFYSYLDVRCVLDNKQEWITAEYGSWWDMHPSQRQSLIKDLLNAINGDKLSERLRASRKLLYIFQGEGICSDLYTHLTLHRQLRRE